MSDGLAWLLLVVFAVHLFAFGALWIRRRQPYYIALVITFALLTASVALRLWGGAPLIADRSLAEWLRYAAWGAAAVSVSWTLLRVLRRRQAGRQNSS
ncbi:hypothetical protein [Wenzhouxiangella sp. EGI_FJ10409]|uniref:hypothetical protein n=1 Tax=Wenzhouxiangella sp. EGI_FJ10409 TaxID=3243767 RepID=UPI0035DAFCAA